MEEGGAWTVILTWGGRSFLTGREGETGRFCRNLQSNESRNTNCSFPETDHGRVELNEHSVCQDHPQVSVHPPVLQSPWKQRSSCQRGSVGGASPTRNFKRLLLRETSRWHHLPVFSSSPPHEPSSGIFSDSCEYFPQFKGNAALSTCLGTNTMATIRRSKPNHLILVWIYYFLTFRQMKSSRILHQQLLFWSSHKCTGNSLQISPCLAPRSLQAPLTVWISLITAQSHTLRIYKHPSQCGEENWRSYLGSHCEDY